MRTRFVREVSCVHGYFQDCTFLLDSGEPCPGGTSEEVDEAPWSKRAVVSVRNRLGTPMTTDELRAFVRECMAEAIRIKAWDKESL